MQRSLELSGGGTDDILMTFDPFDDKLLSPTAFGGFCGFGLDDDDDLPGLANLPGECGSARGAKCTDEDFLRANSSLSEADVAELLFDIGDAEGQGENFVPLGKGFSTIGKKRKLQDSVCLDNVSDEVLDMAAERLEKALKKLEDDNKQLVSCFVTLGEQMQTMLDENKQMRAVLDAFQNAAGSPEPKAEEAAPTKHTGAASPAADFLAQVALMSGALNKSS